MLVNNSQAVFDATASTYDQDRARLLPGYESFYRWTLDLIPAAALRLADLGAGTGLLTAMLRGRFPKAEIHLFDFSAPMLEQARLRLGDDTHVVYHQCDYTTAPLPAPLDAVASSLSIHHLEDERKQQLFASIYAALRPGGVFVNADQTLGPTPELEERYKEIWREQARAMGATEEQIEASLFRQREDRCATVEAQLGWMRQAGFSDADCWFKDNRFAVMAGSKQ
jgi:tRNA (cmo5U34)-methyltransferase